MTRLSRRDRAALVLAYELVRTRWAKDAEDELREACAVLEFAEGPSVTTLAQAAEAERYVAWLTLDQQNRLLRARLALAIRALLRADRGDYGPLAREPYNDWCDGLPFGGILSWKVQRYTPLWESAPRSKT